ncbi:MAG: UDP-N-acetylmuramoyl-L-alanine--D-glutamate ligase [Flavobacteriales bacterium]|jgi:UDP-N-acetylmuramoylalanine--D-glutamate ligase|nr:UDP-N-acetylmuramoyl-L-alanine--D-glutamate ligase [Flavobacteriales bacterium]MBT5090057.1 UDP-N-acetylmuramoyl-L-alanine--D-glutamate ligase [Flavobacteriales bacterium]MBT5750146.1 UDP-N-acetylmuramoyl-L-alanine--D-glutamate ligase [Flavobacteriales bacterium]
MVKRIVVLGAGLSGVGAAVLAKKKGFNVFVSDKGTITDKNKVVLLNNEIEWEEQKHSSESILNGDEVIKSPGIPDNVDLIQQLIAKEIPVISEIEFAFRYTNAKIAAITGSNGKTTTTLLLGHVLKSAGYDVLVAGNVGVGFALSLSERDYDYIVLELSSFQLDGIQKFRSDVAILLNITADHLDRYNNKLENYAASKFRITENQTTEDVLIYNADDAMMKGLTTKAKKLPISLTTKQAEGGFYNNNEIIINLNNNTMTMQELALQGKHNIFNSMAAAIAARVFEVKDTIIRQAMIDFQNIEHRLEYVLTVHGIDFINDSKATNVNACWYSLESMTKEVVWIVGGVDKGNDYVELTEMVDKKVKAIICLGENNENIISAFKGKVEIILQASSMKEAVHQSYALADKQDVVLLSPACASFDLFANYEDRGMQFKKQVRNL